MKKSISFISILVLLLTFYDAGATTNDGKRWGLGLAGSMGVSGLSGTMDTGGPTSYQLIVGNGIAGKFRYAFQREKYFDLYLDGFAGIRTGWDDALCVGGGVGIDWDCRSLDPDLPPISLSLDMNIGLVDGDLNINPYLGLHFNF